MIFRYVNINNIYKIMFKIIVHVNVGNENMNNIFNMNNGTDIIISFT